MSTNNTNECDAAVEQSNKAAPTKLVKTSSLIVGARISGAIFGVLTQILLAKFLSAEDIGLFFVTTGLAAVLSIVCTLGYPMMMPRIAAQAVNTNDAGKLTGFVSQARVDTAIFCGVVVASLLLIAWGAPSVSQGLRKSLIFAAMTLPAFALLRLNGSLANAQKRFELGFLPDLFIRPFLLLTLVLVAWLSWRQMSIDVILGGHVVIAMALAAWQMSRLTGKTTLAGAAMGATATSSSIEKSDWRRRAAPLIVAAVFIGVFADLDIVIARLFLDDAQIGIFGVCIKISLFIGFAIQAIHQLILRDTADALEANDTRRVHKVMARANQLTLAGSIGSTLVVLLFGREILGFFGAEFQAGHDVLVVLMLAQVVRAAAGPAAQVLTLSGHENLCLPVFSVSIIVLLVGNAVMIEGWGLLGAAGAVLIVSALWSCWLAIIVRARLGLKTNIVFASA